MKHTVVEKQKSSHSCFVCGIDNGSGLHAEFFQLDNNELMAVFTPREEHQSYPGRTHGGVSAAMLDETIGRRSPPLSRRSGGDGGAEAAL